MRRALLVSACVSIACAAAAPAGVLAQDEQVPAEDPYGLDKSDTIATEEEFVPALKRGVWELGLQFGSMGLSHKFVEAQRILVDIEEDQTSALYADMSLEGQSSFSPVVRLSRTFGRLALENSLGFALGDFQQVLNGPIIAPNVETENVLSENEIQKGSYFVWFHDHALSYYVLTRGRVLPYVSVGAGTQHYFLDSKSYVDGIANAVAFSFGGGVRVIGDELFSIRLEVRDFVHSIQFDARDSFRENAPNPDNNAPVGERLIDIPLTQLDEQGNSRQFTDKFAEESFSNLWFSVGLNAAF